MRRLILKQYREIRQGGMFIFKRKIVAFPPLIRSLCRDFVQSARNLLNKSNLLLGIKYETSLPKNRRSGEPSQIVISKNIIVFTYVWGSFVLYYDKVLMRSLFQSGNIPALLQQGYLIELRVYTQESDQLVVEAIIEKYQDTLPESGKVGLQVSLKSFRSPLKFSLDNAFFETMQLCVQSNAYFFSAFPDCFFGNHSMSNAVALAMGRNLCVLGLPFRVDDKKFLNAIQQDSNEISNRKLVGLALKHPFKTILESFIGADVNASYFTGMTIQPITSDMFAVTFRIPSMHLASFTESDLNYFSKHTYENLDHGWPTLLLKQERCKIVGSSELFFLAEVTQENTHYTPVLNHVYGNDSYLGYSLPLIHTELNRNFFMHLQAD